MFFTYNQNNSGGKFIGPHHLIVEAKNAKKANKIAKQNGVYFDGCSYGKDCSCCGDRWYAFDEDNKGTKYPEIYGDQDLTDQNYKIISRGE